MTPEQEAIAALIVSLKDTLNGWPARELHEDPELTIQRGLDLLPPDVRAEIEGA